jgi:MinD superfamily P-loop ATPase
MKQLVILSGKGGTGKTTIGAALAHLASQESPIVLADADVDAANLELVLKPDLIKAYNFTGQPVAFIDPIRCTNCGRCYEVCRFDAIVHHLGTYQVSSLGCEGCASCCYQCSADAINMEEHNAGGWFVSQTRFGPLVHARLGAGQENSGKLVMLVTQHARTMASEKGGEYLIVDGPPGIGCPVIAACTQSDLALLVTEPSLAGIHDLERALSTVSHFKIPVVVCINKCDLNPRLSEQIATFCEREGIKLAGQVPFDVAVTQAMLAGQSITEFADGSLADSVRKIWTTVREALTSTV